MSYTPEQLNKALGEIKDVMGAKLAIMNTCRAIAREDWSSWGSEGAHQWISKQIATREQYTPIQVEALTLMTMQQFLASRAA